MKLDKNNILIGEKMKYKNDLEKNAKLMVTPGKGILAADESSGTIAKRLDQINVESSFENRLAYRDMLFTTNNLWSFKK